MSFNQENTKTFNLEAEKTPAITLICHILSKECPWARAAASLQPSASASSEKTPGELCRRRTLPSLHPSTLSSLWATLPETSIHHEKKRAKHHKTLRLLQTSAKGHPRLLHFRLWIQSQWLNQAQPLTKLVWTSLPSAFLQSGTELHPRQPR